MKLLSTRVFEGRNIYAHRKCIRLDVDLEGYSEIPSKDIDGFNEKLLDVLPEVYAHSCGIYEEGGFVKRLGEGTYLAHICEHMIIALQNKLGLDVSYGKARVIEGDKYYIIFEYIYKKTAIKCVRLAIDLINSFVNKNNNIDFVKRVFNIKNILGSEYIGPSTEAICNEAKKMGVPIFNIEDSGLFQLGCGKYGKYLEATICENTSAVAADISCDKLLTKTILSVNKLPVLPGYKIQNSIDLIYYGEKIGYPLVLKPQFGNQGKGVIINIKNRFELLAAYNKLLKKFENIFVEKYIKGKDYRICVVDGKVVAVAIRIPPFVIGNGKDNIGKLIDNINKDPRRGEEHEKPLTKIKIDRELQERLQNYGYSIDTILKENEKVFLRDNANLSTGGVSIDCTDDICNENIEICVRAATAVGLNICGIDICCEDISRPLKEDEAIIEINCAPGIRMHYYPFEGDSRNVAKAIVNMMFKEGRHSAPIISITGTNGKTTSTRLVGHIMQYAGYKVGMSTTGGIYINNKLIEKGDTTGYDSAMAILLNREIEAAVLETARGGIIRRGLAYNMADVGVITNITEDHLGIDGIKDMDDLINVKSLVIEAIKDDGYAVLNGDDSASMKVIEKVKCNLIIFSKDYNNTMMKENMYNGGIGVYVKNKAIYVSKDGEYSIIAKLNDIPITMNGTIDFNIENCLAAISALIGIGMDIEIISKGIKNFYNNEECNIGRFNTFDLNGVKVILDYGHNKEGYKAVISALKTMKHKRIVGVIGAPGDRLDKDILDIGKISGESFDYIYIKEDKDKRGRCDGEVAEILKQGVLSSNKISELNMEIIEDEENAFKKALDNSKYGDIIIVFFEKYEPIKEVLKNRIDSLNKIKQKIMA